MAVGDKDGEELLTSSRPCTCRRFDRAWALQELDSVPCLGLGILVCMNIRSHPGHDLGLTGSSL